MTGTYTIPPGTALGLGDVLEAGNDIAAVLAANSPIVSNVLNTAFAGGADPTGAKDSTAAFQAVLTKLTAGGGAMYVPAGSYLLDGELTYDANYPLYIFGDGPQASRVICNLGGAASTYLTVTQTVPFGDSEGKDGTFIMEGLSFYNNRNASNFTDTNNVVTLNGVNYGQFRNVATFHTSAAQRFNQCVILNECNQIDFDNCNFYAVANGIVCTGLSQGIQVRGTTFWQQDNAAISATGAGIYVTGALETLKLSQVGFHDGTRAILFTKDAKNNVPSLLVGYDVEMNNHGTAGIEIAYGSQVYLTNCYWSGAQVAAAVPGILFGSTFSGSAYLSQCQFSEVRGHSIQALGGVGFDFSHCYFVGAGRAYKWVANTYDEISIGPGVGAVTIDACHFNVDAVNATSPQGHPVPRSAVYAAAGAGNVILSDSLGAGPSYYGTAAVVDLAGTVMKKGNTGLGLADSTAAAGGTVTAAASSGLSQTITVPAYDMTAGKMYKLTAYGHGTQAAGTAQGLTLQLTIGGQSLGSHAVTAGPAAGAAFNWRYEAYLVVRATGTSGSVVSNETFTWAGQATNHGSNGFTLSTEAGNAIVLQGEWAAATGSPTITCDGTLLEPVNSYRPG